MAWKSHAISSYKVSVGSQSPRSEYGDVQLSFKVMTGTDEPVGEGE